MSADRFDRGATIVVVLVAIAVGGAAVHREFSDPAATPATGSAAPIKVDGWRELLAIGIRTGPPDAPLKLIEFADFECPFCATMHDAISDSRRALGDSLEYVFVHFPLVQHRFALPAARVAECAYEQGRFDAIQDELYAKQDSFGLRPWRAYALTAGVADLEAFDTCAQASDSIPRVTQGLEAARRLGLGGTPTLIVNGWRYSALAPGELKEVLRKRLGADR